MKSSRSITGLLVICYSDQLFCSVSSMSGLRGLFFTESLGNCVLNACALVLFWEHAVLFIGHSELKKVSYWEVVQVFFFKFVKVLLSLKNKTFQQLTILAVASASSSPQIQPSHSGSLPSSAHTLPISPLQCTSSHIPVLFSQLFLIISHANYDFPIKLNYISLSRWVCSFIQSLLGAF